VKVAAAIEAAKRERSEATRIDAEWVLREAVALYERCIGEVKPALHPKTRGQMRDADGNLLFTFQAATAARVLELIGRHVDVGAFEERVHVEHDLTERIRAARARVGAPAIDADYTELPARSRALPRPVPTPEPKAKPAPAR